MLCGTEERSRCLKLFGQIQSVLDDMAETDLMSEGGIKCKWAPYQGKSDSWIST